MTVSDRGILSSLTNKVSSGGILSSITSAIKGTTSRGTSTLSNLISKYSSNTSGTGLLSNLKNRITTSTTGGTSILSSLTSAFNPNSTSKYNVSNAISTLKNNIQSRTGGTGVLSNLFSNAKGLINKDGTGVSKIANLNVFGGLNNLISNVKGKITGTDGTSRIDTMGVLGLSTTLGGISQRVQDSFNNWKSKLGSLIGADSMSGIIESSSETASGKMTGLFSQFREYAQNMSNRLFGISEEAAGVDDGYYAPEAEEGSNVLGARDAGVAGATEDLGMMSSSSGYDDGPGVAGATADLSQPDKTITDLAKDVMDGKYGNGQARKDALGDDYAAVQAEINNYLKTGKWSDNGTPASGTGSASKQDGSSGTKNTGSDSKSKSVSGGAGSTAKKTTTTTSGNGKTTEIPDSVKQTGIIANYTQNYNTRGWGYDQKKMANAYKASGSQTDGNIATIDGRYLVAVSPKFGKVGDNIDIQLENGETIPAVIADVKGSDATSSWGHELGGKVDVVEWEINGTSQDQLKKTLKNNDWYGSEVVSITNTGSGGYF